MSLAAVASAAQAYSYVDADDVVWSSVKGDTRATCTFTLVGGPAQVSVEMLTNGVSVGTAGFSGDVNKVLTAGEHTFYYVPEGWRRSVKDAVTLSFSVTEQSRANGNEYLAVNLLDGTYAYYATAAALPVGVTDAKWKTTHLLLKRVSAANVTAMLGKNPRYEALNGTKDSNNYASETFARPVPMTSDYYLGVYEFTAGQWEALEKGSLTGTTNPSATGKKTAFTSAMTKHYSTHQTDWGWHPCSHISKTGADTLMEHLSTRSGLAFSLPTDEQWEYACRAGSPTARYLINGVEPDASTDAKRAEFAVTFTTQQTYYGGAKDSTTHPAYADTMPAGSKAANAWGFYDMYGNLREWTSTVEDPTAATLRYFVRGDDCAMSGYFNCSGGRQSYPAATSDYRTGFRACLTVSPLQ